MTAGNADNTPTAGRILRQRGEGEFLVQTGPNTARAVDVATGSVNTVPDLKAALASDDWEEPTDPAGAEKAIFLVKASEARWRKKGQKFGGIDFSGKGKDGKGD